MSGDRWWEGRGGPTPAGEPLREEPAGARRAGSRPGPAGAGDANAYDAAPGGGDLPDFRPRVPVTLTVNGEVWSGEVPAGQTLLALLRDELGLTGTKLGCGQGNCGACSVLVDGELVYSCLTLAAACDGRRVETVEGLARGDRLHPIQEAFIAEDALQCGFCTPGQIMAVKALLDRNPRPTREEVITALSGNLCRCGAYTRIVAAALRAAEVLAAGATGEPAAGEGRRG